MKKVLAAGVVMGVAAAALTGALVAPLAARERLSGEQQLAKMLEGRVAGKPVSCISLIDARSSSVIEGTAIVYDTGSTLYVNKPLYPEQLRNDDVLVTQTWGSQLCRLDQVRLVDRGALWWRGTVGLDNFVPYTKVKPAKAALSAPQ